jgi:hypothetical protein
VLNFKERVNVPKCSHMAWAWRKIKVDTGVAIPVALLKPVRKIN